MNEKRCYGCGTIIQSDDVHRIGYVPKNAMNKDEILCQRCFKIKNYNDLIESNLTKDDFLNILQEIGQKDAFIVYIIDLFDFNGSLIQGLNRHLNTDDILILANKRDLLPKSINDNRIINWLQHQLKISNIRYRDLLLTSSKNRMNFDDIVSYINKMRHKRDVYVVGVTNVGKSSFINALLKSYSQDNDHLITTSVFPGTTLDLIEIPLDEQTAIYDTPGIINEHQMAHIIDPKLLNVVIPQSEIKPITFQLHDQQTLYFSGLARMDYISGDKTSFTCHFARKIKIHRCKLENADDNYNRHQLLEYEIQDIKNIKDMKKIRFDLPKGKVDIVISGLGFISVECPGGAVEIHYPQQVGVFIRKSLL